MSNWKEIWDKKDRVQKYTLECMVKVDGFDSVMGTFEVHNWIDYCENLYAQLGVREGASIYDVGCGSGAFLYPLYLRGHTVGGLDYSQHLVDSARALMPSCRFTNSDAVETDASEIFDIVVAHGVFNYFPDVPKAGRVIKKMFDQSEKVIGIFDVNNIELKDWYHKERMHRFVAGGFTESQYRDKYRNLDHLFFSKEFFESIALEHGLTLDFSPQTDTNYGNSHLRFNVILRKPDMISMSAKE